MERMGTKLSLLPLSLATDRERMGTKLSLLPQPGNTEDRGRMGTKLSLLPQPGNRYGKNGNQTISSSLDATAKI